MNHNEAFDVIEKALEGTGLKVVHDPETGVIASHEDGYISVNIGLVNFPPCGCDECAVQKNPRHRG